MCEINDVDLNLYLGETIREKLLEFIWNIGQTYTTVLGLLLWIRLYVVLEFHFNIL
jgi:hypothetical protein